MAAQGNAVALQRRLHAGVARAREAGHVVGDVHRRRAGLARHPPHHRSRGVRGARSGAPRAPAARRRAPRGIRAATRCARASGSVRRAASGSKTNSGTTRSCSRQACASAGRSATRRSRRNQTTAVSGITPATGHRRPDDHRGCTTTSRDSRVTASAAAAATGGARAASAHVVAGVGADQQAVPHGQQPEARAASDARSASAGCRCAGARRRSRPARACRRRRSAPVPWPPGDTGRRTGRAGRPRLGAAPGRPAATPHGRR